MRSPGVHADPAKQNLLCTPAGTQDLAIRQTRDIFRSPREVRATSGSCCVRFWNEPSFNQPRLSLLSSVSHHSPGRDSPKHVFPQGNSGLVGSQQSVSPHFTQQWWPLGEQPSPCPAPHRTAPHRTAPLPRSNHAPAAGFAGCAALETASPRAHQSPTAASPAAHCAERFPCPGCSCAEGGALKPAMPMEFKKKKRKKRHQSSSGQKPELDFIKQSQYHHKHLQARATSPASLFPSSCFFPAPEARIQQNAPAPATSARPFPGQSQAGPTDTTTVGFSTPGK